MTDWFAASRGCACCGGTIAGRWPIKPAPAAAPTRDLCCDACGKTLYLVP